MTSASVNKIDLRTRAQAALDKIEADKVRMIASATSSNPLGRRRWWTTAVDRQGDATFYQEVVDEVYQNETKRLRNLMAFTEDETLHDFRLGVEDHALLARFESSFHRDEKAQ